MELRTRTRFAGYPRLSNYCAQCGEVMFMPEWSEYHERAPRAPSLVM